jgi:polar amino acid transport system substrate-binding protein
VVEALARIAFLFLAFSSSNVTNAMADDSVSDVAKVLAPTGRLRAAINFGNTVLAQRDPATGEPRGISAELARGLAKRLGVAVAFVTFDAAGKVTDAVRQGLWDIAFLAIDPVRGADIDFTAPYVLIEGTYLVPSGSPLQTIADVDRDGVRIAVGRGSAYDLHLTRALKHATLIRADGPAASIRTFIADRLEAVAGVKQPLVAYAGTDPGVRIIPGRFMSIEQAMATPKRRDGAVRYLQAYVEEMKASGFVAEVLAATGQGDAAVAPPAK